MGMTQVSAIDVIPFDQTHPGLGPLNGPIHLPLVLGQDHHIGHNLFGLGPVYGPTILSFPLLPHLIKLIRTNLQKYTNSGAAHHVTNNPTNLMDSTPLFRSSSSWKWPSSNLISSDQRSKLLLPNQAEKQNIRASLIQLLREKVLNKSLLVQHIPALDQNVDVLTKSLPSLKFLALRNKLKVVDILTKAFKSLSTDWINSPNGTKPTKF
ncbi:hypothetical protein CR513_02021, partial [Mucuna pruriens]